MNHVAVAVQDNPATIPAKTIEQLIVEGSAELIAVRSIAELNSWLAHLGVDYCIPAVDTRLNQAAANLATANHAQQKLRDDHALARDHLATLKSIAGERDAIKRATDYARTAMEQLDTSAAAAVARRTDELSRAQHSILLEVMAGHVDRAEHALLKAVAALRDVGRIGAKHLGADAGADYIPNPRVVALLAG